MTEDQLARLAFKAAKESDEVLERICHISSYWGNDVLDVLIKHFGLEPAPTNIEGFVEWQNRVLPKLEKLVE